MLYTEIKSFVNVVSLQKRKTAATLLSMPKETFKDILELYIYIAGILKSEGVKKINTPVVKIDSDGGIIHLDFEARDFNYLILSKGNHLLNDIILRATIEKCAIMVEQYIESKLIKNNPQYNYFSQFVLGNYEGMKYVFNTKVYDQDILFTYKDFNGEKIKVVDNKGFYKFNKELILLIEEQLDTTDLIKAFFIQLRLANFSKYKSIILNAAQLLHKGENLEEDGEFMMILNREVSDIEEDRET